MSELITREVKYAGFRELSDANEALFQAGQVGVTLVNEDGTIFTAAVLSMDEFETDRYLVITPNDKVKASAASVANPGYCFVWDKDLNGIAPEDVHETGVGPVVEIPVEEITE
jgi:hypothetical protein